MQRELRDCRRLPSQNRRRYRICRGSRSPFRTCCLFCISARGHLRPGLPSFDMAWLQQKLQPPLPAWRWRLGSLFPSFHLPGSRPKPDHSQSIKEKGELYEKHISSMQEKTQCRTTSPSWSPKLYRLTDLCWVQRARAASQAELQPQMHMHSQEQVGLVKPVGQQWCQDHSIEEHQVTDSVPARLSSGGSGASGLAAPFRLDNAFENWILRSRADHLTRSSKGPFCKAGRSTMRRAPLPQADRHPLASALPADETSAPRKLQQHLQSIVARGSSSAPDLFARSFGFPNTRSLQAHWASSGSTRLRESSYRQTQRRVETKGRFVAGVSSSSPDPAYRTQHDATPPKQDVKRQ